MVHPDMLEHPHGNDPVIESRFPAVIAEEEADLLRKTFVPGPKVRVLQLFLREGDSRDFNTMLLCQGQSKSSPPRTDIKNLLPRMEQKLGGEMAFFQFLAFLKCFIPSSEIAAGVLPVLIEEEVIEMARKVIMPCDVAPGAGRGVDLEEASEKTPEGGM